MIASGSIITTSTTSHPDLFFAIRGGGSNFGVVTELVFNLHPQRPAVYAGYLFFEPPALEKILEVTKKWWANVGEDEAMLQFATVSPDGNVRFRSSYHNNTSSTENSPPSSSSSSTMDRKKKGEPILNGSSTLVGGSLPRIPTTALTQSWPTRSHGRPDA